MSEFTKGKWEAFGSTHVAIIDRDARTWKVIADLGFGEITPEHIDEIMANTRLVSTAPEMYELLCKFLKIHEQKIWAEEWKNGPAYMEALIAEDRAINTAEKLITRIDHKQA